LNCVTLPSFYYHRAHASIALNFYCHLGSWGLSPLAPDKLRPWQSSRKRSVEKRFEGEKCLSQNRVGGKRKRAECRLRKGGGQWKGKRSKYWER